MLELKNIIDKGSVRECYQHPTDPAKCVKVVVNGNKSILLRELKTYKTIKPVLHDYIAEYSPELVMTNKGPGLISEIICDTDGSISKTLKHYFIKGEVDHEVEEDLNKFTRLIFQNDLFFYDLNLKNLLLQKDKHQKKLKYIDLKSFNKSKFWTFFKLEYCSHTLARIAMRRRIKRLYQRLGFTYPGY